MSRWDLSAQVTSWLESYTALNYSPNTINLVSLSTDHLIGTPDDVTLEQQGVLVFGRDGVEAADWHWPGIDPQCASPRSEPDVQ